MLGTHSRSNERYWTDKDAITCGPAPLPILRHLSCRQDYSPAKEKAPDNELDNQGWTRILAGLRPQDHVRSREQMQRLQNSEKWRFGEFIGVWRHQAAVAVAQRRIGIIRALDIARNRLHRTVPYALAATLRSSSRVD
jgi:hypothetical protein